MLETKTDNESVTKEVPGSERAVEAPTVSSDKIRYGAPDGPRQRRANYDGRESLEYAGHEALAQFLAAPTCERVFKSFTALADHYNVTRMTIHRWKQDMDVMRRAYWLSKYNQMAGDLVARREWEQIMEKVAQLAEGGNMQAIKFCAARAWPDELRGERSLAGEGLSFAEAVRLNAEELVFPTIEP